MISVIIPSLNAASALPGCIAALSEGGAMGLIAEIIVSDGGSSDDGPALVAKSGARLIEGPAGRGGQLRRGAGAATGQWLLFLHADTHLQPGWSKLVATYVERPGAAGCAAYFHLAMDDDSLSARVLAVLVGWRCRVFALPYGDQGLLISRVLYDAVGGYPAIPLMEDVALIRKLGRARLTLLPILAVTSAARYLRHGYLRRSAANLWRLMRYFLGADPARLARQYERSRDL